MTEQFSFIHACRLTDRSTLNCTLRSRSNFDIYYFLRENSGTILINGNIEKILHSRLFFIPPSHPYTIELDSEDITDCFHIRYQYKENESGTSPPAPFTLIIPQEQRKDFDKINIQLAIASVLDQEDRKNYFLSRLLDMLQMMSMHCCVLLATRNFGRRIQNIPRHLHQNEFQVDYFVSGGGTIFLDSHWVDYTNGSLCFVPPNVSHEIVFAPAKTIDNYSIKFRIKDVPGMHVPTMPFAIHVPEQFRTNLLLLCKRIVGQFVMDIPISTTLITDLLKLMHAILQTMKQEPESGVGIIQQVIQIVSNRFAQELRISTIATEVGISPEHLSRLFRKELEQTLSSYITDQRLNAALVMMQKTNMPFKQIAVECGFKNVTYFNTCFKKRFHGTPKEFRNSIP
ncbi:MAG: AraC family transcriptional regulator [Sphaerochaeta sp.]|nr:AraC family transcriptional regulator [Sphaerochaeta sp.]